MLDFKTVTIREDINQTKRKAGIITYTAFAVFALGIFLSAAHKGFVPVTVVGFLAFMAGTLYLLWGIRCPSCLGRIGFVTSYYSTPFSISRKIRFCPFCGVGLDSRLDEKGKV